MCWSVDNCAHIWSLNEALPLWKLPASNNVNTIECDLDNWRIYCYDDSGKLKMRWIDRAMFKSGFSENSMKCYYHHQGLKRITKLPNLTDKRKIYNYESLDTLYIITPARSDKMCIYCKFRIIVYNRIPLFYASNSNVIANKNVTKVKQENCRKLVFGV